MLSRSYKSALLLILLCLGLYLPGMVNVPVFDRDEAHFAQATKQMLESGNYFAVQFQNTTRYQKPPGINWLQALSVKLLSHANSAAIWPYRVPSVLGAMLAVLLLFYFLKDIFDQRSAFLASALLASSVLLYIEAHMAVTDSCLLACVIAMQGSLWRIYRSTTAKNSDAWIFWLAMSIGFVIKGITPLIGFLTLFGLCIVDRNVTLLKKARLGWGLVLLLLTTTAWVVGTSYASGSNYLWQMFHHDLLPKLRGGDQHHGGFPGYYILIFSGAFWPGSLFIMPTLYYCWKERQQTDIRFILMWVLPSYLFYLIMPTKLPQYMLPLYPAIAAAIAVVVMRYDSIKLNLVWRSLQLFQLLVWLAIGLGLAGMSLLMVYAFKQPLTFVVGIATISMLVGLMFAVWCYATRRRAALFIPAILGMMFSMGLLFQVIFPSISELWVSNAIAKHVINTPLQAVGYSEPSLVFILGTKKVNYTNLDTAIRFAKKHPHADLLINQHDLHQLHQLAAEKGLSLKRIATIHGFNYSHGKWVTLIILRK